MVKVKLYGALKTFGSTFELEVRDTAEVLRALCTQLPNFRQALMNGHFKVRIGKDYLDNRYLEKGLFYRLKANMTVHITPVVRGAKFGAFQIFAGIALIGAAFFTGGLSIAAWGAGAQMMGMMGASLLLGGVAQMLTKTPKMGDMGKGAEKKQSTAFSSLQNMAAQGRPVPLAYGKIRVGSLIISQGVETFEAEMNDPAPTPQRSPMPSGNSDSSQRGRTPASGSRTYWGG